MEKSCFLILATLLGLVSVTVATAGTATYYTPPYTPSACFGNISQGTMIAAASDAIWNKGAACGRNYTIMCTAASYKAPNPCTGSTVRVKIVDYCPNCNVTFDLSKEAFRKVSKNLDVGKIKIEYNKV